MNIEDLMKSQWQDAENIPPKAAWDRLEKRLDAATPTPKSKPSGISPVAILTSAVVALAGVAVALLFATGHLGSHEPAPALVAHNNAIQQHMPSFEQNNLPTDRPPQSATSPAAPTKSSAASPAASPAASSATSPAAPASNQVAPLPLSKTAQLSNAPHISTSQNANTSSPLAASMTPKNNQAEHRDDNTIAQSVPSNRDAVTTSSANSSPVRHEDAAPSAPSSAPATSAPAVNPAANPAATTSATEAVEKQLYIPNLLTPNSDGYNDCWVLKGTEGLGTIQVQIFSAKGRRVYSAPDYANDFCGADLPSGNYFYIITIKEKDFTRRGVLVIRR